MTWSGLWRTSSTCTMDANLHLVETLDDAQEFRRWLGERRPILGIDTETTGLRWWTPNFLRTVQFGDAQTGWTIPYEWWGKLIADTIADIEEPVVFHNAKFDLHALRSAGMSLRPGVRIHDTKHMSWLLDPPSRHGLKPLSVKHIDKFAQYFEKQLEEDKKKHGWDWATTPVDWPSYWIYAATDPVFTSRLAEKFWPEVDVQFRAAYDQEMAVSDMAFRLEERGMRINLPYVEKTLKRMLDEMSVIGSRLHKVGIEKPGSGPLIAAALQADGWEPSELTPTGEPCLSKAVLRGIDSDIAVDVLAYRKLKKVTGSYLQNFVEMADGDRLHASINTCQAKTGRMSVTEPALQTLPRGWEVRRAFIPEDGQELLTVDYAGIELRLLAHFTGDERMVSAFHEGRDLHNELASRIFGAEFTKAQRSLAKNSWYAKIYGAGVPKFAETNGLEEGLAQQIMDGLGETYPGIPAIMRGVDELATSQLLNQERPHIYTVGGRRLFAEKDKGYTLLNYLIQGTAAEVLKSAMVRLDNMGLTEFMLMPVHDELVFSVPKEDMDDVKAAVEEAMTDLSFSVPLTVEADVVSNWGQKYEEKK